MPRIWGVLVVMLAAVAPAEAQRFAFKNHGPDEGLNTTVTQFLQDRAGFLWVATANGLYRYDGARFEPFGPDSGLPSASIRRLHEAADGTLWAATSRGLARSRRGSFEAVDVGVPLEEFGVYVVTSDRAGRLYVGYEHGLLLGVRRDGNGYEFRALPGFPTGSVSCIFVEPDGAVWFGSGVRLYQYRDGRLREFAAAEGLAADRWRSMLRDSRGNLWVRGVRRLFVQPAGESKFVARDSGLPQSSNDSVGLLADGDDRVMTGTDQGLARMVDGKWQLITTDQGLESDSITAIYRDREGSIWLGVWGAGVTQWMGQDEWAGWTKAEGLSHNLVWAVRRHPSGSLWLGTEKGITELRDPKKPRILTQKDGLAGDKVKTLAIEPNGTVWAGSLPGGISRIDPATGRIRVFARESGLADDRIISVHLDAGNRLWVSTSGGLFRSTDTHAPQLRFERQFPPGATDRDLFYRFLRDSRGRIWVGSTSGLYRWDQNRWTRFTARDGLKRDGVTHIAETADGELWIGYREPVGLSRLVFHGDQITATHFTKEDKLTSNYMIFLGLDARQRLWVGTDNGINVAKPGQGWTHYTREDGLTWDDCAADAFFAESDGTVWIGTLKGLSRFRREPATPRRRLPQLPSRRRASEMWHRSLASMPRFHSAAAISSSALLV